MKRKRFITPPAIATLLFLMAGCHSAAFTKFSPQSIGGGGHVSVESNAGGLVFTEFPLPVITAAPAPTSSAGPASPTPAPPTQPGPRWIAQGPDGAMWFTEERGSQQSTIGRITSTGAVTYYTIPAPATAMGKITSGPDGALWFAESQNNKIGRITVSGSLREFAVPTVGSGPVGIITGPDGALWFTETGAKKIGRITTAGVFSEYPISSGCSPDLGITVGPDKAIWFTEPSCNKIARITTAGVITEVPMGAGALDIVAGPDGNFWVTIPYPQNAIGKVTPTGQLTTYAAAYEALPKGITVGPDNHLWFTESSPYGAVGTVTTAGSLTEFAGQVTQGGDNFNGISAGPGGTVWFPEHTHHAIGRVSLPTPSPVPTASLIGKVVVNVTAAKGGTITVPSGPSLSIPAAALSSDSSVELDYYSAATVSPPPLYQTAGAEFDVKFGAPVAGAPTAAPLSAAAHVASTTSSTSSCYSFLSGVYLNLSYTDIVAKIAAKSTFAFIAEKFRDGQGLEYVQTPDVDGVGYSAHLLGKDPSSYRVTSILPVQTYAPAAPLFGLRYFYPGSSAWSAGTPPNHTQVGHPILLLHGIFANVESTYQPDVVNDLLKNGGYDMAIGYDYNWLNLPADITTPMANDINSLGYPILDIVGHSYGTINAMALIPKLKVKQIQNLILVAGPLNGAMIADKNYLANLLGFINPAGFMYGTATSADQAVTSTIDTLGCQWHQQYVAGGFSSIESAMMQSPNHPIRIIEVSGDTPFKSQTSVNGFARSVEAYLKLVTTGATPGPQATSLADANDGVSYTVSSQEYTGISGSAPTEQQFPGASIAYVTPTKPGEHYRAIGKSHTDILGDDKALNTERAWIPKLQVSIANGYFGKALQPSTGSGAYVLVKGTGVTFFGSLSGQSGKSFSAQLNSPAPELTIPTGSVPESASNTTLSAANSLVFKLNKGPTTTAALLNPAIINLRVPDDKGKLQTYGYLRVYEIPECYSCVDSGTVGVQPPVFTFRNL